MALNLGVEIGSKVYIDDRPITVQKTYPESKADLLTDDGVLHHVTTFSSVEVYPSVFVSVGRKSQFGLLSLTFEAPQNILILREELYLRGSGSEHCVSN